MQIDFSVNATYSRPFGAIATDGSPHAHVFGSYAGPKPPRQVFPAFFEV